MPLSKDTQPGFFISPDNTFHTGPAAGDKMIRPKERKIPKKKHTITPYGEVMQYVKSEQAKEEKHGIHDVTTLDGDEALVTVGPHGTNTSVLRGDADMNLDADSRPVLDEYTAMKKRIAFSDLSPKAQALYYKFKREGKVP
jgi:hypothetical protein